MGTAVTNATVLIFLAKVSRLDLLQIYKRILTTPEIHAEVLEKGDALRERHDLEKFFRSKVKVETPLKKINLDLGDGETSALSLCIERKILIFLSDDKKARKVAEILSIKAIGTVGIILENLKQNKITKQGAKKILQLLLQYSYYLSADTYAKILGMIESHAS